MQFRKWVEIGLSNCFFGVKITKPNSVKAIIFWLHISCLGDIYLFLSDIIIRASI